MCYLCVYASCVNATFSFHKITTHKKLKWLPYILFSHFTWLLQWFIILDINNLVNVSHHYWKLLKLSIKLKSTWAAKWGSLFKLGRYNSVFLRIWAQIPIWTPLFSWKYSRRAHRDPQTISFFIKTSKWEKWWSWWLRMTNAFILCNLLWKVLKSLAANREGSFKQCCKQTHPQTLVVCWASQYLIILIVHQYHSHITIHSWTVLYLMPFSLRRAAKSKNWQIRRLWQYYSHHSYFQCHVRSPTFECCEGFETSGVASSCLSWSSSDDQDGRIALGLAPFFPFTFPHPPFPFADIVEVETCSFIKAWNVKLI